jgi:hypothetical protein
MKKVKLVLPAMALLLICFTGLALAQDFMTVGESGFYNAPKALLRTDASLWDQDFRDNPALLDPGADMELIMDAYYTGSSSDALGRFHLGSPLNIIYYGSMDADYLMHNVGADIGLIMKRNDRSSLGFIFSYSWEGLDGDGSFFYVGDATGAGGAYSYMNGSLDAGMDSNSFALSALYDIDFSETLSLGASLTYAYINNKIEYDVSGFGVAPALGGPENLSIDREMTFDYHRITPVIGISLQPTDALVINSSVSTNIYLGSVEKVSDLFDDIWSVAAPGTFPTSVYTEKLDSNDVLVLDIAFNTDGEHEIIPEKLSLPFFLNFTYGTAWWNVDGATSGYFAPATYYSSFQGPGTIQYGDKTEHWTVSVGGGVDYVIGGFDLTALVAYSHLNLKNSFEMDNYVVSTITLPGYPGGTTVGGLTGFSQDIKETWDVLSFELGVSREFSEKLSAEFTTRYDIGWGNMDLDMWYTSPYDYAAGGGVAGNSFDLDISDRGVTHYLTLATYIAYSPIENLSLSLEGMIGIPLDDIRYDLSGSITQPGAAVPSFRCNFGGPSTIDLTYRGYSYGGMFNIEYKF